MGEDKKPELDVKESPEDEENKEEEASKEYQDILSEEDKERARSSGKAAQDKRKKGK
jgi:hypothetical protein